MNAKQLRIGNLVYHNDKIIEIKSLHPQDDDVNDEIPFHAIYGITLTEEWLLNFGFSVINENSAGKRYGYVIDSVFSSDLIFTFWKSTKEKGKFFRADLELNSVHQLQNLYFALTGEELVVSDAVS